MLPAVWPEASARIDVDADPTATLRIIGALLLRKARIHTVAVLRPNETNNLHSLAVQMRPVLECAGQVVFFFHNTMIAPNLLMEPERAAEVVGNRLNADHYQTLRSRTKGEVSPEELGEVEAQAEEAAAAFFGANQAEEAQGTEAQSRRQGGDSRERRRVVPLLERALQSRQGGGLEGALVARWWRHLDRQG